MGLLAIKVARERPMPDEQPVTLMMLLDSYLDFWKWERHLLSQVASGGSS